MLYIICIKLAAIAKAFSDTVAFHWPISIFYGWKKWAGPMSWENKNKWSDNEVFRFLLRTALVPVTDAWHFGQWVMLTAYQVPIALHLPPLRPERWINLIFWMVMIKIIHGAVFELCWGKLFLKKDQTM